MSSSCGGPAAIGLSHLARRTRVGAARGYARRPEFRAHRCLPLGLLHAGGQARHDWHGIAVAGAHVSGFLMSLLRNRATAPAVMGLFTARTDALLFAPLASVFQPRHALLRTAALSLLLVSPYLGVQPRCLRPVDADQRLREDVVGRTGCPYRSGHCFSCSDRGQRKSHTRFFPYEASACGRFSSQLDSPSLWPIEATRLTDTVRRFFIALFALSALHVPGLRRAARGGSVRTARISFPSMSSRVCSWEWCSERRNRDWSRPAWRPCSSFRMVQSHRYFAEPHPGLHRARYELALEIGRTLPPTR